MGERGGQPAASHVMPTPDGGTTDGRMSQQSLLLVAPLRPGDGVLRSLENLLARIARPPKPYDLECNPVIPFRRLGSVHFARILVQYASAGPPMPGGHPDPRETGIVAKLLFATDFDGTLKDHLIELIQVASDGLDQLFEHCEGWPGLAQRDRQTRYEVLAKFVGRHAVVSNTFYTGTMHRSVEQIRREADLRDAIDAYLDGRVGTKCFPKDAVGIRERIRTWVFSDARFEWAHQRPGPFPSTPPRIINDHLIGWGGLALLVIASSLTFALTWVMPLDRAACRGSRDDSSRRRGCSGGVALCVVPGGA